MDDLERVPVTRATVGLDLSIASTGICVRTGAVVRLDTIKTTPRTCANDLARLRRISDEVMARIPDCTAMVCVEDIFMPRSPQRMRAAIELAKLAAVVRLALLERGLPFSVVTDSQLKKYACGKGSGVQKSVILREVFRKWGIEARDDNQADATVLAYMAEALLDDDAMRLKRLKYERDVLDKVERERPRYNVEEDGDGD
jgi:Holliday junction resolvasome RuvABC endonuclease subunit